MHHSSSLLTLILPAALAVGLPTLTRAQVVWINEFHYDNSGPDQGEFVEIAAPAGWTDLGGTRLTLYNGGDGKPYGTPHLLSSFTQGETSGGITFFSKLIPGLQNGAPDGLALDVQGSVHHFISYEGGFTAQSGPAAGLAAMTLDAAFSESESTPIGGALALYGTGSTLADFTWKSYAVATPGYRNPEQVAVPEPHEYAIAVGAALGGFAAVRRRRRLAILPAPPEPMPMPATHP